MSAEKELKPRGGQNAAAFLEKLYEILSDDANRPYIDWVEPDGTSFLIKKVPELQEIVLPKYFKHNNLPSFVRQLNMYRYEHVPPRDVM